MKRSGMLEGPGSMLFSAVIFGFFGFFTINWSTPGLNGQPVLFRELLGWTLRVASIMFAVSAVLTLVKPVFGNLVAAMTGVVSAVLFLVVVAMDLADPQHGLFSYSTFILPVFAAWNGYGSAIALLAVHREMSGGLPEPSEERE